MSFDKSLNQSISIKTFTPKLQEKVKKLIIDGLFDHWGYNNPSLNPDLNDISASYDTSTFLVALIGDIVVGAGALIHKSDTIAEIVRMSVDKKWRRKGVGTIILDQLCRKASSLRYNRLILETASEWKEVISFYCKFGFQVTHEQDGEFCRDTYFALDLK